MFGARASLVRPNRDAKRFFPSLLAGTEILPPIVFDNLKNTLSEDQCQEKTLQFVFTFSIRVSLDFFD